MNYLIITQVSLAVMSRSVLAIVGCVACGCAAEAQAVHDKAVQHLECQPPTSVTVEEVHDGIYRASGCLTEYFYLVDRMMVCRRVGRVSECQIVSRR